MELRLGSEGRLLEIEGVIEGDPYTRTQARGEMGRFDYRPPKTMFVVQVDTLHTEAGTRGIRGGVLVDVPAYDGRLGEGDRVRCMGWGVSFGGPMNPGERDFGRMMAERGVVGRLSLDSRGNLAVVTTAAERGGLTALRQRARQTAAAALHAGLWREQDTSTAAMLDVLLLGERRGELGELDGAFRRSGLSHILAISGMHLSIVVAGALLMGRVAGLSPAMGAMAAVGCVGMYLMIVTPAVPVLRAGIMAAIGCGAMAMGRRVSAGSTLGLAALVLLMWRPGDLFTAGFQLSFGIVAALVMLTRRVSNWIMPRTRIPAEMTVKQRAARWAADYGAMSLVAWATAMPVVAFHFHVISPLSALATAVMTPVMTGVLWLGYLKMAVVSVVDEAAGWIGPVLWWAARAMAEMVMWVSQLPGSSVTVPAPSGAWLVAAMLLVTAGLAGLFHRRVAALTTAGAVVALWLAWPAMSDGGRSELPSTPAALRINMFAVGDGSCFLLRSGGEALMFDCGSSNHLDITTAVIAPALRQIGVLRIDTLVLSHPDTDHFSGCLELIDTFGIRRVVLTKAFLDEAQGHATGAAAFVIDQINRRGLAMQVVAQGHREVFGEARIDVLWPPATRQFEKNNDSSIVMALTAAGRRVLMTGDVQQEAMTAMMMMQEAAGTGTGGTAGTVGTGEAIDLRADVLELPHHGSMVPAAPGWVAAVGPRVVMQSTARGRLAEDKWAGRLPGIDRHITARHGMVEIMIDLTGEIFSHRTVNPPQEPGVQ
jgi:competence protein ComEC